MECYAGEAKGGSNYWLYSASGERLSNQSLGELAPKAVFWLEGTQKVFIVGNTIYKWPREKIGTIQGRIVAIADCLGDWREELITSQKGEIRIYTTSVPASSRRTCLMQDRLLVAKREGEILASAQAAGDGRLQGGGGHGLVMGDSSVAVDLEILELAIHRNG